MIALRMLLAAVIYYGAVFGSGIVLGSVRVLLLEPRIGVRAAELVEAPLMLAVILVAALAIPALLALPRTGATRLGVGLIALLFMLASELTLVLLRQMTLAEYVATKDVVAGIVFAVLLAVFALAPAVMARLSASAARPRPAAAAAGGRADTARMR